MIKGPCSYCGNEKHWRPDCPFLHPLVLERTNKLEHLLIKLINKMDSEANIAKEMNWEICVVCKRYAPLVDNECPDCRH